MSLRLSDINFRDPFVLPIPEEGRYYLYGTVGTACTDDPMFNFHAYTSSNLVDWEGPIEVFHRPADFWADRNYWAPEVHRHAGRFYMFATFKSPHACRGTQVLVSDSPCGPFTPISDGPVTPRDWECLDGTLHVDSFGRPWVVFCHEWLQVQDGEIWAVQLNQDLSRAVDGPALLFRASDAPWVRPIQRNCYVTDGPFVFRAGNGDLLMLWASFGESGYAEGVSKSVSGDIKGPWVHEPSALYYGDGGHSMLFRTFDNDLMLTLHTPNTMLKERPVFLPSRDIDGKLVILGSTSG